MGQAAEQKGINKKDMVGPLREFTFYWGELNKINLQVIEVHK